MVARILVMLGLLFCAAGALAGNSILFSGQPGIINVTLDKEFFSGTITSGANVGTLTVINTNFPFAGTLALSGPNASSFSLSGTSLNAATTLVSGVDYSIIVTPTQSGVSGSGQGFPIHVYGGLTYFMAVTGNDSNNGTSSGTPWKTPKHNIHCGDVISAAVGTYLPQNLGFGSWGVVSCPTSDNIAKVKCAGTLMTCQSIGDYLNKGSVAIDQDYWGVEGFEAEDASNPFSACFFAAPSVPNFSLHHVAFINDIANTCGLAGFSVGAYNNNAGVLGPLSTDYVIWIGDISYNGTHSSSFCGSGFSLNSPAPIDSKAEPHVLITQNIANKNVDGPSCAGSGVDTDGSGLILDRLDIYSYTPMVTVERNLWIGNGNAAFHFFNNSTSPITNPTSNFVMVRNNTGYGNTADPDWCPYSSGEFQVNNYGRAQISGNVIYTVVNELCGANPGTGAGIFTMFAATTSAGTLYDANWVWNAGNSTYVQVNWASAVVGCNDGTTLPIPTSSGNNNFFCSGNTVADPVFAGPVAIPDNWNCTGFADTWACAATTIAAFTPTASGSTAYGFTVPTPTDQYNSTPFFRNVLHNVPAVFNPHGF